MNGLSIRQASEQTGLSADTLRYYEKLGLIGPVPRTPTGQRRYGERDMSRLHFILRARRMSFSLEEIAQLLQLRDRPLAVCQEVRQLTHAKLEQIRSTMKELSLLQNELELLLNLCPGQGEGPCPIIEQLETKKEA